MFLDGCRKQEVWEVTSYGKLFQSLLPATAETHDRGSPIVTSRVGRTVRSDDDERRRRRLVSTTRRMSSDK